MSEPRPDQHPVGRTLTRAGVVLAGLAGAALLVFAGARTWARADVLGGLISDEVRISGNDAFPALLALALVVAAASLALSIAGRVTARALAAAMLLSAVVSGVLAVRAITSPQSLITTNAAEQVVAPSDAIRSAAPGVGAWLALCAAWMLIAVAAATWVGSPLWAQSATRYDRPDPSTRQASSGTHRAETTHPSAESPDPRTDAAPADPWDALSLGADPTLDP